ncbi:MAG: M28 family peptidase [Ferruginibacter sp.]
MRTTLSIFFILLSIASRSQSTLIDSIITKESLQFTISALAHDSMKGRLTGTREAKNAADFIAQRFKMAGLRPLARNDNYFAWYPFESETDALAGNAINVWGAIKGMISPDTFVIFCAHYDHIGIDHRRIVSFGKDSVYNGANDNASGVALLIELAKYYAALKTNRYTLIFIAFSGEELGLLGSAYTASHVDQSYIHALVNFDMVGRSINRNIKKCMVIAKRSKPIIKKLNAEIYPQKGFFIADMFPAQNLFTRSDQYSFNQVENNFFLTTSSALDDYYHTLKDEFNTIDFDFLLLVAKNAALGCKIVIK